jgi:hypothetical protein
MTTEKHMVVAGNPATTYVIKFDVRRDASRFIVVDEARTSVVAQGLIDTMFVLYDKVDSHTGAIFEPLDLEIESSLKTLWRASQERQRASGWKE